MRKRLLLALLVLAVPSVAMCQGGREPPPLASTSPGGVRALADVPYRTIDGRELALDLYLPPEGGKQRPAVLFVHGGGFIQGHRRLMGAATDFPARLAALAASGYVVASIEYRFSPKAFFPAQVQDAKAAIAWLRDHADDYGIDPDRIAIWGTSAGGTIATTVALSCGDPVLEPDGGDAQSGKSCVQAAADWFGPTSIDSSRLSLIYLGCVTDLSCDADRVRAASPITHITPDDPPFLIVHGDSDVIVPLSQSQELDQALRAAGVDVELQIVKGAGHGLYAKDPARQMMVLDDAMASLTDFLDRTIGSPSLRGSEPVAAGGDKAGD
jgi:acetyl esterase/lipase